RGEGGPPPSRRSCLKVGGLGIAALALWAGLEALATDRRLTGSKHAGSFSGNAFPVTQWTFDPVLSAGVGGWRVAIRGLVANPGAVGLDALARSLPQRSISAV